MDDWLSRWRGIVIAGLVAFVVTGAVVAFWRLPSPAAPLVVEAPSPTAAREIKVYVTGEVVQTGVYALRQGDRVEEAILAAGGATAEADLERINLSMRVKDEDHIHVPRQAPSPVEGSGAIEGAPTPGKINLNTATMAQLDSLPGIGPVTGGRILDYREKNGPFRSVEELLDLKLVGQSTYDKIKDLVTVK